MVEKNICPVCCKCIGKISRKDYIASDCFYHTSCYKSVRCFKKMKTIDQNVSESTSNIGDVLQVLRLPIPRTLLSHHRCIFRCDTNRLKVLPDSARLQIGRAHV